MKREVGIAELKAHLSEYIRAAQKGKEIVIKDRDTPVAKLSPIEETKLPFKVIPAKKPIHSIDEIRGFRPSGVTPEEIERIIQEVRADRDYDEWLGLKKST